MVSSGLSRKISVQRARTSAGMLGMAAASKADTNSVQTGQSQRAAAINAAKAMTDTIVVGTTTRDCPSRSTSREICGAAIALVSA